MRCISPMVVMSVIALSTPALAATKADPQTPANVTVEQVKAALKDGKTLVGK